MKAKGELLEQLREVASRERQKEGDEPLWIERATDGLSAEEEARLGERAATDEAMAIMLAATGGRDASFEERLLGAAMAAHKSAKPAEANPTSDAAGREAPRLAAIEGGRADAGRATRRHRWRLAFAPALVAAAAIALWLRGQPVKHVSDLPDYEVSVQGADAFERGAPTGSRLDRLPLSDGARVHIIARPATPVRTPVEATAFLVGPQEIRTLSSQLVHVSPAGVAHIEGGFDELFGGARGDADIVLFIGPSATLPHTPAEASAALSAGASARVVQKAVRLVGRGAQ